MKKFMFAFFAMVFAFVVGCGNSPESPDSPIKGAYKALCDAASAGDKAKLEELIDCNDAKFKAEVIAALIKGEKSIFKSEVESVEEKGDTAILALDDGSNLPLKKIDDKWKLQIIVTQKTLKIQKSTAIDMLKMSGMFAMPEALEMLEPEM